MSALNFWKKKQKLPYRNLAEIKNGCRILFIDDQKFDIVDRLREKEGWKNTTRIKDLDSISQTDLQDAHIVFVDIQGVGKKMKCQDEGLGLIKAIRQKYPNKKLVMYSGENAGSVDAFHEACNMVDDRLRKGATQYEFNLCIEKLASDAFCLENCIRRIKAILYNEYAIQLSESEIEKKLNGISANNITERKLSSIFNIQNAANIANILQLFYSISTK